MRYGVIADIHGNLPALDAAVAALRERGVDRYLHLGDLVGYGPFPNECVDLVRDLGAVGVAGNHDLIATDRLSGDKCLPLARETLAWTKSVLTGAARSYLSELPLRLSPDPSIVATHGSLDDPEEYVRTPAEASAQLERLRADAPRARMLLVGHTHEALAVTAARHDRDPSSGTFALGTDVWLLNPGSVGQSRTRRPRAECLVLDFGGDEVTFLSLPYDVQRTRRELLRHDLPPNAYHTPPTRLSRVRRAARASLSRTRRQPRS